MNIKQIINLVSIASLSLFLISSCYWSKTGEKIHPKDNNWRVGIGTSNPLVSLHNNGDFITKGPWVDVRAFGASTENNASLNDDAFNVALNHAYDENRPLYIPAGTWKFNDVFSNLREKNNLAIIGDGPQTTILEHKGSGVAIGFDHSHHVTLRNLTLKANAATSTALLVKRSWWGDFSDIYIEGDSSPCEECDYPEVGISLVGVGKGSGDLKGGAYYNKFENITARCANNAIELNTEWFLADDDTNRCNSNTFLNVNAYTFQSVGYKIRRAAVNSFLNCQIEGGKYPKKKGCPIGVRGHDGIYLDQNAHSNIFMGGYVEGITNACIHIGPNPPVRYNLFVGQRANPDSGVYVIEETWNHVSNNIFIGTYGERSNYKGNFLRLFAASQEDIVLGTHQLGDDTNYDSFQMNVKGKMEWGEADTGFDTELYRSNESELKTNAKFIATGGIGVGNDSPASELGTVIKKIEVFNQRGESLGFIAVYDEID